VSQRGDQLGPLVAEAHKLLEAGHVHGKLVLAIHT
jgi:hypothetical protein